MDFSARLQELSDKIRQSKDLVLTEQATKSAFIMPFLQLLGYDVFNPAEVVPEYTADVGIKKGEKVDFAVLREGSPVMLIECKCCGAALDAGKCSQLIRYFHTQPSARIGILTNGTLYQFFTDLEKQNVMDQRPFMEFDLLAPDKTLIPELIKLTKSKWDIVATLSAATELKYTRALKAVLAGELQSPGEDLVRLLAGKVYEGSLTAKVREMFASITRRAFQQLVNDMINERLTSAMIVQHQEVAEKDAEQVVEQQEGDSGIITTEDEIEGFHIVKSILRTVVDPKRIVMRDTKSYCGILLDDTNRKQICRLRFNAKQKYIGLLAADKSEEKIAISCLDDIYTYADRIKEIAARYAECE